MDGIAELRFALTTKPGLSRLGCLHGARRPPTQVGGKDRLAEGRPGGLIRILKHRHDDPVFQPYATLALPKTEPGSGVVFHDDNVSGVRGFVVRFAECMHHKGSRRSDNAGICRLAVETIASVTVEWVRPADDCRLKANHEENHEYGHDDCRSEPKSQSRSPGVMSISRVHN